MADAPMFFTVSHHTAFVQACVRNNGESFPEPSPRKKPLSVPSDRTASSPGERDRLDALRRYEILDTEPEAAFDDIARLAARLCHTPSPPSASSTRRGSDSRPASA
jgi:hypothetical protein